MTQALIIVACLVVILAGVKASASLLVPFLLAAFLTILLARPFISMRDKGIPSVVGLVVMILCLGGLGVLVMTIVKPSLDQFNVNLPTYEANLKVQLDAVWQWFEAKGIDAPKKLVVDYLDPQFAMTYVGLIAKELSGMLGQVILIFIIVAFMLVEASGLYSKISSIPGISEQALGAIDKTLQDVRSYVSLKAGMSLLTGALVAIWLWFLGIDNALFMGMLAFFLNFVPTIGSIIAAIPGVLLGFIIFGPPMAAVTAIGYVVINVGISNVIEPQFMSKNLDVSPLIVVVSLIFWGWLLGPVGMLLSIPLTILVKVGLESSSATKPIAVLLGAPPKV